MLEPLTLAKVAEATGGTLHGDGALTVTSVSSDSRTIEAGALFVALPGEKFDGHDYIPQALLKGALAAVTTKPIENTPHVLVENATVALGRIARASRDGFSGPVIGVTGSVGKTTTRELLACALGAGFLVHKSAENFNNEIGVPQTILSAPPEAQALVLEMGMRGAGQIAELAAIAAPSVGVITGIGVSHIELLGSRAAIAAAKAELFEALPEAGVAVFPARDAFAAELAAASKAKTLTVALEGDADVKATALTPKEGGWAAEVATPWGSVALFVPSPGRFNVQNALLAVAVAGQLGVPLDKIAEALKTFTPPAMRLETLTTAAGATLISDCYNAAPDSMVGALETLVATPVGEGGQRIAVLGEMRELGRYADEGHALVGKAVAALRPNMLVLVGSEATRRLSAAALADGFPLDSVHYFDSTEKAAEALKFLVMKGDAVLVKGSRGVAMEGIVEALL